MSSTVLINCCNTGVRLLYLSGKKHFRVFLLNLFLADIYSGKFLFIYMNELTQETEPGTVPTSLFVQPKSIHSHKFIFPSFKGTRMLVLALTIFVLDCIYFTSKTYSSLRLWGKSKGRSP